MTGSLTTMAGLHVYWTRPAGATAGVLLAPAVTGIGPAVCGYADRLAEAGLAALVWDPFRGQDVTGWSFEQLMPLAATVTDAAAVEEQRRLVNAMTGEHGIAHVGVLGWCMGGRLALILAAKEARLAACAAYHPSIRPERRPNQTEDPIALAPAIRGHVLIVHPGADQVMTAETLAELRGALEGRPTVSTAVQIYPGADHGFMERPTSDANRLAARLAWPQTIAFLQATLA